MLVGVSRTKRQKLRALLALEICDGECVWDVLGGSWDLVSKVISTLIGVISTYKYSYLIYNLTY